MEISLPSPLFRSSGVWEVRGQVPDPFLAPLGLASCKMRAGMFVSQGFQTQKEPESQRRLVGGGGGGRGRGSGASRPRQGGSGFLCSTRWLPWNVCLNKRFLQLTHQKHSFDLYVVFLS